jgi:hypothetical protein
LLELDEKGILEMVERSRRSGELPLANMADVVIDSLNEEVEPVRSVYHMVQKLGEKCHPALEIQVGETNVEGSLGSRFWNYAFCC